MSPTAAPVASVSPEMTAREAVADALLGFAGILEEKAAGVIAGNDADVLHDFRVALRRTRSVAKLVGDVFPAETVDLASRDLKWLAERTTPVRDADVMLAELGDADLGEDLDGFVRALRHRGKRDRRALTKALTSKRYAKFMTDWRTALVSAAQPQTAPQETPQQETRQPEASRPDAREPVAAQPVTAVADERLGAAYAKVAQRGAELTADSPAAQVHRLRKRCKELRYLLEIFRGLYPASEVETLIKQLRRLQDLLGDFQDRTVRIDAARGYVTRAASISSAEAFAVGQYAGEQVAAQRHARAELVQRIRRFNSTARLPQSTRRSGARRSTARRTKT